MFEFNVLAKNKELTHYNKGAYASAGVFTFNAI
jgi:hypothetical protein